MNRKDAISDEALLSRVTEGDVDAEEMLVRKYSYLVRICSRPYFLVGGDNEDLTQEGMMGLLSAVRRYDPEKDAKFETYAELCIKNRLYTAIKSATRIKHSPLNDSMSIESPQFDESRTTGIPCHLRDPEELVITRELTDEISFNLRTSLSKFENDVLGFYLEGLSYSDISKEVNKPIKSVDNAVQRIRKKLARFL